MLFVVLMSLVVAIVVGLDHVVALALRYDARVGSEVLHFVVGNEVLVVVGDEVEHLGSCGSCGCCRSSSSSSQDL